MAISFETIDEFRSTSSSPSITITQPAANELIVYFASLLDASKTISSVQDQNGDNFTDIQTIDGGSGSSAGGCLRYKIADGDETSITISLSASTGVMQAVSIYSGTDSTSPLEASNVNNSHVTSGSNNISTNSATAVNADGVAVYVLGTTDGSRWQTADNAASSSGTIRGGPSYNVGSNPGYVLADLIYTSAGAKSSTFTTTPASFPNWAAVAVFKEASSGAYTLACDSGSYTYTGTAAALEAGRLLSADSGSYSYSGTSATLTYTRALDLACDSGSYTYTGTQAALTASRTIGCDSGTYTYSGTSADFSTGYGLVMDSGSYTYSGTSLGFKRALSMGMSSGAYVYSGSTITFNYSGAGIWTVIPDNSTSWSVQADSSDTWTVEADSSDTWTVQ